MAKFTAPQEEALTSDDVMRIIDTHAQGGALWDAAPPSSIDPSSIKTAPLRVRYEPGAVSDYTITGTIPTALANTSGYFDVTGGRDVEVRITATSRAPATGSFIVISAMVDGVAHRAIAYDGGSTSLTTTGYFSAPAGAIEPGRRLFSVGAHVTAGTAIVFAGPANTNYVEMVVKEII